MSHFQVERMPRVELDRALESAAREGWNPGWHDAECFWAIDPTGFFMGVLDGRVIGRASALVYDDHFAFCGLYVVDPESRGQGYGLAITQARLRHIGKRNAGLDGVAVMVSKYERLGYRTAHRSIRYAFTPRQATEPLAGVVRASDVPFEELVAYDARHFPARRAAFLERWIAQPGATALAYVEGSVLGGFGVIRPCRTGHKIGPLFAGDERIADALFQALCNQGIGGPVFLDTPEPNHTALKLAERYGMSPEFECARMYLRGDPELPLENIYGVTTFEAG